MTMSQLTRRKKQAATVAPVRTAKKAVPDNPLVYINLAIEDAISRQLVNPHAPSDVAEMARQEAASYIAGVPVIDPERITAHKEHRRQALREYQADAKTLRQTLNGHHVPFHTIWSAQGWETLRVAAELYRFTPDHSGQVNVAEKIVSTLTTQMLDGTLPSFRFLAPNAARMARLLWPDFTEAQGGIAIGIDLPPAPDEVKQTLLRAHKAGLSMVTYVEGAAIALTAGAVSQLEDRVNQLRQQRAEARLRQEQQARRLQQAKEAERRRAEEAARKRRVEEEAARRRREAAERERLRPHWHRDPIITVSHGKALAIIAQYGAFKVEKQLIQRVLNSSALI